MSQLKYDVAEFVVSNRDELNHYLNEEMGHMYLAERLFDNSPEIFDEMIENFRISLLSNYLAKHFNEPMDNICLIVDGEFVKMTLQY